MKRRSNYSVPTLEDQILVDATEAVQGIDKLRSGIASLKKQIDDFSKNNGLSNFSKNIKKASVGDAIKKTINFGAVYLGAKQVLGIMQDMNKEAVDYTETVNLFNVSFGKGLEGLNEYYEQALDFQERLEEKLGVNIEESMRYQALFNSMTKSMGLGAEYAYTMSENMTKLGYDLASLYNIDPSDAMTKLRAGLAGQTEPLRELGLDITEQSLKPVAESLGVTESIRNMSQAEKAVLRYIAVLRQAQIAQGDFANTMESPANQLRIFNAQVTSFKRNMGNLWQGILGGILPYVNAVMMVINELLKMVAKLFGFEVSSQPVNVSASIGADDLADDLGTASGKAKELKNQLMGFDEINNISLDTGSAGSSSGGASNTGIDQRLLDALKGYDNLMNSVSNKATEIRDKMLDWLGFERDDNGTWKLKEGLTNFEKILDVAKLIGIAIGTWKISSAVTNLLKNLGILKGKQNFQLAFGLTLTLTGIMAQWQGTSHLLDGDIDLFTILETLLGTAGGALGIVNILKATKLGKTLSLGNKLKVGFGIMLGIQGIQVFLDGISEGDVKKTILGALESVTSLTVAFNGLFGKNLITSVKNTVGSIATFGIATVSSFKNARASGLSLGKSLVSAGKDASSFLSTGTKLVAGLAGITAGSALTYASMKDLATGEIDATEGVLKLASGLGVATASGALAGSQFGIVGTVIGGLTGLTTSAITAFMGYKDGIESLNIPVTTLTGEIQELSQEIDANRQAHENAVQSIKDTYESQIVEAEYASELSNQLAGLVDANGKVTDSNKDRVNVILGQLNQALGTEYKLNGNIITRNDEVIDSYKELRADIDKTIAKKKEEAEQEAFNDLYAESIKNKIQAERDYAKVKEEYAKAEIEYNNLMAQGLSTWTLEHDENCKQIIQNYIDMGNKLKETGDATVIAYEDYAYYTEQMANDTKELATEITGDTELITNEMIKQNQITSQQLQAMVQENVNTWNASYNELDESTKASMLAQSTTLDTWCPTLQQKWTDMANGSEENFKEALSKVPKDVETYILSSITKTEGLTPNIKIAWAELAEQSETEYSKALSKLDDTTAKEIQNAVNAINGKQRTAGNAGKNLGGRVSGQFEEGLGDGKTSANNWLQGFTNQIRNPSGLLNTVWNLGSKIVAQFNSSVGNHSPSKLTKKSAQYFMQGFDNRIKQLIPSSLSQIKELGAGLTDEFNNSLGIASSFSEIKVNSDDFSINTNQFIDYGRISGSISMQSKIDNNIPQQIYNAVIEGMRNARVQVDIEAKTDKGIMFKTIQEEADDFAMRTGENPFPVMI